MKLDKNLVAATSAPIVLSVLAEGDSYGYAIIQRVREISDEEIVWTDGMLYPVLHWLEERRFIKGRWEKTDANRRRRYYSITEKGREELASHRAQWNAVNGTLKKLWRLQHA